MELHVELIFFKKGLPSTRNIVPSWWFIFSLFLLSLLEWLAYSATLPGDELTQAIVEQKWSVLLNSPMAITLVAEWALLIAIALIRFRPIQLVLLALLPVTLAMGGMCGRRSHLLWP